MKKIKIDYNFKIILIGEHESGISQILLRYTDCGDFIFTEEKLRYWIEYRIRILKIYDKAIKLQIWDNPPHGCIRYLGMPFKQYKYERLYKGTHGFIFVYDLSEINSFEKIKEKIYEMKKYEKEKFYYSNICKILIGNKCDIDLSQRCVNEYEVKKFASDNNMDYYETSAKNNINIDEAFECLTRNMVEKADMDENYMKGFSLYKIKNDGEIFRFWNKKVFISFVILVLILIIKKILFYFYY